MNTILHHTSFHGWMSFDSKTPNFSWEDQYCGYFHNIYNQIFGSSEGKTCFLPKQFQSYLAGDCFEVGIDHPAEIYFLGYIHLYLNHFYDLYSIGWYRVCYHISWNILFCRDISSLNYCRNFHHLVIFSQTEIVGHWDCNFLNDHHTCFYQNYFYMTKLDYPSFN